jgi:hypothetical protein
MKGKSILQSSHYRKVSTYPLGSGRRSIGISEVHFGNHCLCSIVTRNGLDGLVSKPGDSKRLCPFHVHPDRP